MSDSKRIRVSELRSDAFDATPQSVADLGSDALVEQCASFGPNARSVSKDDPLFRLPVDLGDAGSILMRVDSAGLFVAHGAGEVWLGMSAQLDAYDLLERWNLCRAFMLLGLLPPPAVAVLTIPREAWNRDEAFERTASIFPSGFDDDYANAAAAALASLRRAAKEGIELRGVDEHQLEDLRNFLYGLLRRWRAGGSDYVRLVRGQRSQAPALVEAMGLFGDLDLMRCAREAREQDAGGAPDASP